VVDDDGDDLVGARGEEVGGQVGGDGAVEDVGLAGPGGEEVGSEPGGEAEGVAALGCDGEGGLVAAGLEVAPEEDGAGVEAVVARVEGDGGVEGPEVVGGGGVVGVDPAAVVVVRRELGEGVDLLPLELAEAGEGELGLGELDGGGDDAVRVLVEVEGPAVELELFEAGGGASDDLDGGGGVDVADEAE
jgi:hypothetical protein